MGRVVLVPDSGGRPGSVIQLHLHDATQVIALGDGLDEDRVGGSGGGGRAQLREFPVGVQGVLLGDLTQDSELQLAVLLRGAVLTETPHAAHCSGVWLPAQSALHRCAACTKWHGRIRAPTSRLARHFTPRARTWVPRGRRFC